MTRQDIRAVTQAAPAASRRKGAAFTLVELLVVIGIIALLVTILSPAIGQAVEVARRGKCATNLKAIVHGCQVYAMNGTLHRGRKPASLPYVKFDLGQWYKPSGNKSCLWLLIDRKLASPEQFICPSLDKYGPGRASDGGFKWTTDEFRNGTFSYAFQSMVRDRELEDTGLAGTLRLTMSSTAANRILAADMNPRFELSSNGGLQILTSMDEQNSQAHKDSDKQGAGQNVARWDQSVKFVKEAKLTLRTTDSEGNQAVFEDWIYRPDDDLPGDSDDVDGSDSDGRAGSFSDTFLVN